MEKILQKDWIKEPLSLWKNAAAEDEGFLSLSVSLSEIILQASLI